VKTTRRGFVAGLLSLPFVGKLLGREEPDVANSAMRFLADQASEKLFVMNTMLWGDVKEECIKLLADLREKGYEPVRLELSPELSVELLSVLPQRRYQVGTTTKPWPAPFPTTWYTGMFPPVDLTVRHDLHPNELRIKARRL
jgi:hypothetical protein